MMSRHALQAISWLACIGTVLPSILYLCNILKLDETHLGMLLATIVWFVATPLWMGRESATDAAAASND